MMHNGNIIGVDVMKVLDIKKTILKFNLILEDTKYDEKR